MNHTPLYGILLHNTYVYSGIREPIERYFASMFSSFYDQSDSQPSCSVVKAIVRGKQLVPRKLLCHYWDSDQPRCPQKLEEDLMALAECCFVDASRRDALHHVLKMFLKAVPTADAEDLRHMMSTGDIIHMWACLTWYAICSDHHGTASY